MSAKHLVMAAAVFASQAVAATIPVVPRPAAAPPADTAEPEPERELSMRRQRLAEIAAAVSATSAAAAAVAAAAAAGAAIATAAARRKKDDEE